MDPCAFCGAPLRPGATFCAACGHAAVDAAPGTPARGRGGAALASVPNPRAGWLVASMPLVLFAAIFAYNAATESSGPDLDGLVIMGTIGLVVLGLAWAVARGAAWARWVAVAASLAWIAFLLWTVPDQLQILRETFASPQSRRGGVFGLAIVVVEGSLALATIYLLVRPRAPPP